MINKKNYTESLNIDNTNINKFQVILFLFFN